MNSELEKKKLHTRRKKKRHRRRIERTGEVRNVKRNDVRARRRKKRRRAAAARMAAAAVFVGLVMLGGGFYLVWNLPALKLERELDAAIEYTESQAYDEALASCEEALSIDSTSVKAYQSMAGAYMDMKDAPSAKKILYEGWETTKDQELLDYYLTIILNEGVAEINGGSCTLETAGKFLSVLEQERDNADAISLLGTAYEWLNPVLSSEGLTFFYEPSGAAGFPQYEEFMSRLGALADQTGSDELKRLYTDYALWDMQEIKVSRAYAAPYLAILEKASLLAPDGERKQALDAVKACLEKEAEVQEIFADIFVQFDSGNYEAAKEFIVTDTYQGIRDAFINGTMEYWSGTSFVPLCREEVLLKRTEEGVTFEYPGYKDNEKTAGMITIYANTLTDEGVPRSRIAYEPAMSGDGYYPHTEYVVSYMMSNVQKKNSFTMEMNYHLETRITTESGVETEMIGDWGGPYEWTKKY